MPHDFKLWCEDCQKGYEGECEEHGPLTHVSDKEIGTRARRSLPHLLELKEGKIRTGVFSKQKLAKRLQFGPLQGICVRESRKQLQAEDEIRSRYGIVFKLVQQNESLFLLDTRFEEHSNWMIFVKPAEKKSEQNLVAFQYKGEIFFATIKEIPAQCELKVWFSRDYAERMGARVLSDEGASWQFRTRQRFNCIGCGVVFSSAASLANHRCSKDKSKAEGSQFRKKVKKTPLPPPEEASTPKPSTSRDVKPPQVAEESREPLVKKTGKLKVRKPGLKVKKPRKSVSSEDESQQESQQESKSAEKGGYPCPVCEKAFHSPGKLKQHSYSHTGERPFSCPHCQKAFSSRFKLGRHQLIHTGDRQHQCPLCSRSFHRKDHLKNHIQIHDPNKQFKCERPNCRKEYNSYMSYRKHCAVHAAEEGDLECKICLEVFGTKADLIYHLKVHVGTRTAKSPGEKKFQCDRCERRFFTRKDVKRHLVVHTGKRDFVCSLCPQKFGRKDHLVRHVKKSHGVSDPGRLESSSSDLLLLSTPGPSSAPQALSPSPSTSGGGGGGSSGDQSFSSILMGGEVPPPLASTPSLQQQPASEGSYSAGSFSSDFRFFEEGIKEEPDLTASMEGIGPPGADDLSKILGMYLPAGSINIPVPSLLEGGAGAHAGEEGPLGHLQLEEGAPLLFQGEDPMASSPPLEPFPHQVCHLASDELIGGGAPPQQQAGPSSSSQESPFLGRGFRSLLEEDPAAPRAGPPTATPTSSSSDTPSTTSGSSLSSLPGFDQAFP